MAREVPANDRSRRILLVSSFVTPHLGGVEQYTEWLRQRLTLRGHECRVVSVSHEHSSAETTVPYKPLGPRHWPFVFPGPAVAASLRREINWADLVLIQYHAYPLSLWSALAAAVHRKKAFTFIHMVQPPSFRSRLYRQAAWTYDRLCSSITLRLARPVAVSALAAQFVEKRFGLKPIRVPFPLRPVPRRLPLQTPARTEPFRIVSACRLMDVKAPLDLVRACDLMKSGPIQLDMYGGGPLESALRDMCTARPWMRMHGPVSWERVIAEQQSSHAVATASLADTTQAALLEPLSMGTPAVATSTGDAYAYLTPPLDRFLCPQMRPDLMAAALDELRTGYVTWQPAFAERALSLQDEYSEAKAESAVLEAVELS
jgi:glycosyltransferase involved in cell wall biosynthesis